MKLVFFPVYFYAEHLIQVEAPSGAEGEQAWKLWTDQLGASRLTMDVCQSLLGIVFLFIFSFLETHLEQQENTENETCQGADLPWDLSLRGREGRGDSLL